MVDRHDSPYRQEMLVALCHSEEMADWTDVQDLSKLSDLRAEAGNLLWAEADVATTTEDDVKLIADEFGLHPLAVEDAIHTRQRPKFEVYDEHLFIVFHQLDEIEDQLEAAQIACFVGERYVLTIHEGAERTLKTAKKRWDQARPTNEPERLLHVLMDAVIDDYQEIADRLEARMEELEELALAKPNAKIQRQLYSLKQQLSRLRRYVLPSTRLLDTVLEEDDDDIPFSHHTTAYFRDLHDHVLRIADQVRNIDELAQAVIDLTQTEQARVLNEVSKKLSGYAAIFAIETLIAGIYGMNFRLVPEDQTLFGFWFAIALMVVVGVGLYVYFKRRDWL
jgi:magnesium transporter